MLFIIKLLLIIFPFSFRDLQSILKNSKELSIENFGLDNVDVNKYFRLSGNIIYIISFRLNFYFTLFYTYILIINYTFYIIILVHIITHKNKEKLLLY